MNALWSHISTLNQNIDLFHPNRCWRWNGEYNSAACGVFLLGRVCLRCFLTEARSAPVASAHGGLLVEEGKKAVHAIIKETFNYISDFLWHRLVAHELVKQPLIAARLMPSGPVRTWKTQSDGWKKWARLSAWCAWATVMGKQGNWVTAVI